MVWGWECGEDDDEKDLGIVQLLNGVCLACGARNMVVVLAIVDNIVAAALELCIKEKLIFRLFEQ